MNNKSAVSKDTRQYRLRLLRQLLVYIETLALNTFSFQYSIWLFFAIYNRPWFVKFFYVGREMKQIWSIVGCIFAMNVFELLNPQPKPLYAMSPIHVSPQIQNPGLYNGCEVTSISMLLSAVGHPVDKFILANQIAKDFTPIQFNSQGGIASWGDPNCGFVGDITGKRAGYGVYHRPVYNLLNQIVPGRAVDFTGSSLGSQAVSFQ